MTKLKTTLTVILLTSLFCFISCSNDDSHVLEQISTIELTSCVITEQGIAEMKSDDIPYAVISDGRYVLMDIASRSTPDKIQYLFLDKTKQKSYLLTGKDDKMAFVEYNPFKDEISDKALIIYHNDNIIEYCKMDWEIMEVLEVLGSKPIVQNSSRSMTVPQSRASGLLTKEQRKELLDKADDTMSLLGTTAELIGDEGKNISDLCDVHTAVLLPSLKYSMAEGSEEEIRIATETATGNAVAMILRRYFGKAGVVIDFFCNTTNIIDNGSSWISNAIDKWTDPQEQEEEFYDAIYCLTGRTRPLNQWMESNGPKTQAKVILTTQVGKVTKNSAHVKGSMTLVAGEEGGIITEQGFCLWEEGAAEPQYRFNEKWEDDILGLKEAQTYRVASYAKTPKDYFYGNIVTFTTKGMRFVISNNNINFKAESGKTSIDILHSNNVVWEITQKPIWCTISQTNNSMTVAVTENTDGKERNGDIIVTASIRYSDGETESTTRTIHVSQQAIEKEEGTMDNTKWNTSMNYIVEDQVLSSGGILTLGNISKGEIYFNGEWLPTGVIDNEDGMTISMHIDSHTNNKLVLVYTVEGSDDECDINHTVTFTFIRESTNKLGGSIYGKGTIHIKGRPTINQSYSGTITGTLIE